MAENSAPVPYSLRQLIREYMALGNWPHSEAVILDVARHNKLTREQIANHFELMERLVTSIAAYLGQSVVTEEDLRVFFGKLQGDFGIDSIKADRLHVLHLYALLMNYQRRKDMAWLYEGTDPWESFDEAVRHDSLKESHPESSKIYIPAYGFMLKVPLRPRAEQPKPKGGPQRKGTGKRNPGGLALSAAYELLNEGKPISIKAASERAGVDRKHLAERYPEVAKAILEMAAPDRIPRRAARDQRTGNLDAMHWDKD